MKTKSITASEYAKIYGCTPQFVSRRLKIDLPLEGMVSWRKVEGRTGSWIIEVLESWIKKNQ